MLSSTRRRTAERNKRHPRKRRPSCPTACSAWPPKKRSIVDCRKYQIAVRRVDGTRTIFAAAVSGTNFDPSSASVTMPWPEMVSVALLMSSSLVFHVLIEPTSPASGAVGRPPHKNVRLSGGVIRPTRLRLASMSYQRRTVADCRDAAWGTSPSWGPFESSSRLLSLQAVLD
jgi:hypothetical protein